MTLTDAAELPALRRIGSIVARCLQATLAEVRPGISTAELDLFADRFLTRHGARSAPRLTYNFPGTTCISVNEEIAHGIPGARVIQAGDVVNVDVSAELGGFFGDTGGTVVAGSAAPAIAALLADTKAAQKAAMQAARAGELFSAIGKVLQEHAERGGYGVVRNLGSHGVGRALHEPPEFIPGYHDASDRRRIKLGDVITVEPFFTNGPSVWADEASDGWTLMNKPGCRSAQFEHTIVVTKDAPIILTLP